MIDSHNLSPSYQKDMDTICQRLNMMGIRYAVMSLVFNDGSLFMLSNYATTTPYQPVKNEQASRDYHLCGENETIANRCNALLQEQYQLYPTYSLVRHHPECTFVFSAIRDTSIEPAALFYQKTVNEFERFATDFIDVFMPLIIDYHPAYKNSFILSSKKLRDSVIRRRYIDESRISLRAQDCLRLAAQGKSAKQIAQSLSISHFTVEQHLKTIREVFQCNSVIEAVIEGIHAGLVGKICLSHRAKQALFSQRI